MTSQASPASDPSSGSPLPTAESSLRLVKVRHDLRNPLGHIMGFSELLLEGARKRQAATLIPELERMLQATDEMVSGVNRSLDPAQVTDRTSTLQALGEHLRAYASLVRATTERCSAPATELGEPFVTDFDRISGAAEKLLSLLPLLGSLSSSAQSAVGLHPHRDSDEMRSPSRIVQVETALRSWRDGAILIIDAEAAGREALSPILRSHGYAVLTAEDTTEALITIQRQPVDLILLNLGVSGPDARSFLQSLRLDQAARHIPLLTLCSAETLREGVALLALGADDFIPKPIEAPVLMARARGALARKRGYDQERAYLQRLQGEQDRSERLLHNLVPAAIGRRLKQGEKLIVDEFEQASVVWARVTNFSRLAARLSAGQLLTTMNGLFTRFDLLAEASGLERSRTQIESYLVAVGVPTRRVDHAQAAATLALSLQRELTLARGQGVEVSLQIAVSSGPLTAGLVGSCHFTYDVWGTALEQAQKLLTQADKLPDDAIVVDRVTYEKLRSEFKFQTKSLDGSVGGRATIHLLLSS